MLGKRDRRIMANRWWQAVRFEQHARRLVEQVRKPFFLEAIDLSAPAGDDA